MRVLDEQRRTSSRRLETPTFQAQADTELDVAGESRRRGASRLHGAAWTVEGHSLRRDDA